MWQYEVRNLKSAAIFPYLWRITLSYSECGGDRSLCRLIIQHSHVADTDIAIVGMAAHLPGAANIAAYWRNLRDGVSSIRRLSEDELLEARARAPV